MKTKLVLGTVQLGTNYGVNNTTGQPTKKEGFTILDTAFAEGITTFDTAYGYGTAEEVLGEWIQSNSLASKVCIISKGKPDELAKSLKRLHVENIDGYLLHSAQDLYNNEILEGLREVKRAGLVEHIGVSVYNETEAHKALELGLDYVQVPYNVFDRGLDDTDFFTLAKEKGITVFARSPFLQGLLLMDPAKLPSHLADAKESLGVFIGIANKYNFSQTQAALLFSLHACRAERIVFGVETLAQLEEILDTSRTPVPAGFIEAVKTHVQISDPAIVNPNLWKSLTK